MFGLSLVTAPVGEPVSLAEAKKQVEIAPSFPAHDEHLKRLITAARLYAEKYTNRQFVTATYDYTFDWFPYRSVNNEIRRTINYATGSRYYGIEPIFLPLNPVQSVTSLKYYDPTDTQQTWDSSNYLVSTSRTPAQIRPALNKWWPQISGRPDGVTIRFVAGYGDTTGCPEDLKAAMLLMIGHWFANRQEVGETQTWQVPVASDRILEMYKTGDEFLTYASI